MMKQQDIEARSVFSNRVETQCDLLNELFEIQNVEDVSITGLSDLVQAHIPVPSDQFPDRTRSETVATSQMYWDGTNKLRLHLNIARSTEIKIAYATQVQRETTDRPFTHRSVRRHLLGPVLQRHIGLTSAAMLTSRAQCSDLYRPRERRQPPVGNHAFADEDDYDDEDFPEVQIDGSKQHLGRVPDIGLPGGTPKRKLTRLLRRALRHYAITATPGPCRRGMQSCFSVLDTDAGVNIVRTSLLPKNWMAFSEK